MKPVVANAVLLSALFAGCATEAPAPTAAQAAADADKQICTREVPTGSLMPVTKCRTLAQIERDRAEAKDAVSGVRQETPDFVRGANPGQTRP